MHRRCLSVSITKPFKGTWMQEITIDQWGSKNPLTRLGTILWSWLDMSNFMYKVPVASHVIQTVEGLATDGAIEQLLIDGMDARDVATQVPGVSKCGPTDATKIAGIHPMVSHQTHLKQNITLLTQVSQWQWRHLHYATPTAYPVHRLRYKSQCSSVHHVQPNQG